MSASGVAKKLVYGKESVWGTKPAVGAGKSINRVTSNLALQATQSQSKSIRTDYQMGDSRITGRRIGGQINSELQCGGFTELWAALLRAAWVTGINSGAQTVSLDATAKTLARATGSWLTDGFKVGDVVRATGFTNAANNGCNLRLTSVAATQLGFVCDSGATLVTESNKAGVTVSVAGKKLMVPTTGHTNDSFTFEHFYSDIAQSHVFTGCRIGGAKIALPTTGFANVGFDVLGRAMEKGPAGGYFTSPANPPNGPLVGASSGVLRTIGGDVALVSSLSINISGGLTAPSAVGSQFPPDVFPGRVVVSGEMSVFFNDALAFDAFNQEQDIELRLTMYGNGLPGADVFSINLPRIRLGGFSVNDGEDGLIAQSKFDALLLSGATDRDNSTIIIQDTLA